MDEVAGCRVYWGSHGCNLPRDHDGPCLCECADDEGVDPNTREYTDDPGVFNVGASPYYGPDTSFYGEDALEVMGRVSLPGVVVSFDGQRLVVGSPPSEGEGSKKMNSAGVWEPWDPYALTIDARPGQRLEVAEEDRDGYPGHLVVVASPA